MRLGEALALDISNIDVKSDTIRVSKILTHDEDYKPYIHESSLSKRNTEQDLFRLMMFFKLMLRKKY